MSDTEKMRFHVTITDNETGETIYDGDTCAILASVQDREETNCILTTDCKPRFLAAALAGLRYVEKKLIKNHPDILMLALLAARGQKEKSAKETEN